MYRSGDRKMGSLVSKLMKEYYKTGKIRRVSPVDENHAYEVAVAIALRLEREKGGKGRKQRNR